MGPALFRNLTLPRRPPGFAHSPASLESGVNDAVWELGVSRATVWRWIKRLAEEGGRTSALASRKRGRPTGTTLISGKVEAVIEEHLRRYFLRRERPSLSRVVTEIRSACWQQGLQPPTRRTVQRRLDAMDAREIAKAREGAKAARQKFAAVTGENKANQPLEVVQIDHTPAGHRQVAGHINSRYAGT